MDIRTLAKVLQEANRLLPQEVRSQIAEVLDKGAEVLNEFGDAFDEATMQSSGDNFKDVVDDVTGKTQMDETDMTFDELIKGWGKDGSAVETAPDAESGGSETPSRNDIVDSIYLYMSNTEDSGYVGWNSSSADWNRRHPTFVVIDFLAHIAEDDMPGLDD